MLNCSYIPSELAEKQKMKAFNDAYQELFKMLGKAGILNDMEKKSLQMGFIRLYASLTAIPFPFQIALANKVMDTELILNNRKKICESDKYNKKCKEGFKYIEDICGRESCFLVKMGELKNKIKDTNKKIQKIKRLRGFSVLSFF